MERQVTLEECEDDDEHSHQQIMFQPELVIRESTAP